MSLENALSEAMKSVPECVACAYVDMDTGLLLGARTLDSLSQEHLDMVAAATTDMFQGTTVAQIEDHFKERQGLKDKEHHYFKEMLVFSDNLLHVFLRTKKHQNHVLTFVCRKSANVGMALAKSRMALDAVSDAI